MKSINSILLIAFLLSSCAPPAKAIPTFTPQPTKTITPSPTATQTPSPTPTIVPTPTQIGGGAGKLIFEYYRVAFEKSFPDLNGELHVFVSNIDGTDLTPVTNGLQGFNRIEGIAPDGKMVLVSSRSNYLAKGDLYLVHLSSLESDPIKLAGGLDTTTQQAIFLDNTRMVYIGQGSQGYGFYTANIDGTGSEKIGAPLGRVWRIVSSDGTRVYWSTIEKKYFRDSAGSLYAYGDAETLWWTNIDGSGQGKLESNGQQIVGSRAFSRDGKMLAWIPTQTEPDCASGGIYTKWITDGSYNNWGGLWRNMPEGSPGSSRGEVIDMDWVEAYVARCFIMYIASLPELDNPTRIVLAPPANLIEGDFTFSESYNLSWKPDGSMLLLFNDGTDGFAGTSVDHEPLLYYVIPSDTGAQLTEYKHELFSLSSARKTYMLGISPDGQQMLIANRAGGPYIRILDLNTMTFNDLFGKNLTPDSEVSPIGSIYWLP
jgi:hypothetical protein